MDGTHSALFVSFALTQGVLPPTVSDQECVKVSGAQWSIFFPNSWPSIFGLQTILTFGAYEGLVQTTQLLTFNELERTLRDQINVQANKIFEKFMSVQDQINVQGDRYLKKFYLEHENIIKQIFNGCRIFSEKLKLKVEFCTKHCQNL